MDIGSIYPMNRSIEYINTNLTSISSRERWTPNKTNGGFFPKSYTCNLTRQ